MRITVIGAGAVGGYFGGRLAEAGEDVTFLVRANRAKQLANTGLEIISPCGNYLLPNPKAVVDSRAIKACDLVILAVKNYHLAGTLAQLEPLVASGAKILPLLNGVEHFDILAQKFGSEAVLGGLCKIISTLDGEGRIHHTNNLHRITFGPIQASQTAFCHQVKQTLDRAKVEIELSEDIWADIWGKYAFITAYSGITTASRLTIDAVLQVEACKELYFRALQEMWNLAKACGTMLPADYVAQNEKFALAFEKGSTSSMHQDFRKGLPLEVESLQGAAIRRALRFNVDLPTVRTLYGLIKPFEHGTN
ncbi:MAG TPA: ketopantoate reductase family protein [Desulfobacteria bacterium]|nr:ketopantoate reductase family protein [Desulfobacteria bacterium]